MKWLSMRAGQGGFTLIELMVVLIIIGLLASLAMTGLSGNHSNREVKEAASNLRLLMQEASDRAVLDNQEIGLVMDDQGYSFLVFDENEKTWRSMLKKPFSPRSFPETLTLVKHVDLDIPSMNASDESERIPDIVFFSSGEHTPFRLEFSLKARSDVSYSIVSDGFSQLHWNEQDRS